MTFQVYLDETDRAITDIKNVRSLAQTGAKFLSENIQVDTDAAALADKTLYTVPKGKTLLLSTMAFNIPAANWCRLYDSTGDSASGNVIVSALGRMSGKIFKFRNPLIVRSGITIDISASGTINSSYQFTFMGVLV